MYIKAEIWRTQCKFDYGKYPTTWSAFGTMRKQKNLFHGWHVISTMCIVHVHYKTLRCTYTSWRNNILIKISWYLTSLYPTISLLFLPLSLFRSIVCCWAFHFESVHLLTVWGYLYLPTATGENRSRQSVYMEEPLQQGKNILFYYWHVIIHLWNDENENNVCLGGERGNFWYFLNVN